MKAQLIKSHGKPEYAVLPYDDYLELLNDAEQLDDVRAFDRGKLALKNGEDEAVPATVVNALLDGNNPVRTWREYRALTQADLAAAIDVSVSTISYIESGHRQPSLAVVKAISLALNVDIDELVY